MRQHPQFCSIKCASLLLRALAEAKQNQLDLSHGLCNIPNLCSLRTSRSSNL